MSMTCKEVEAKLYGYNRQVGDTGKNLVADLLKEVAEALGFNIDLLKEDHNPNKAFQFQNEDFLLIQEIIGMSKSKAGKRLRCRDYEGAGGFFVDEMADAFLCLAEHNHVSDEERVEQMLKMRVHTRNIAIRECIRELSSEFEDDIERKLFMTADRADDGFEDDHMDGVAQQVFLEFIFGNIDEDKNFVYGTYWCYVSEKENDQYHTLKDAGAYLRTLTPAQRERFKNGILDRIHFEQVLADDDDFSDKLEKWFHIEEGQGKLQDNKTRKERIQEIHGIMKKHAECFLTEFAEKGSLPEAPTTVETICGKFRHNYVQLEKAKAFYLSFRAYREQNPVNERNETMMEIGYRQRFGNRMF